MSSWQEYVDDHLIGTGAIAKAAIIGHDGNTRATSTGLTVSPREGAAIASGFTDNEKIFKEGIDANSRKYLVVHANESSIYGKAGTRGICVSRPLRPFSWASTSPQSFQARQQHTLRKSPTT